jgi:hypothetical protein
MLPYTPWVWGPTRVMTSPFLRYLAHIQRCMTFDKTPSRRVTSSSQSRPHGKTRHSQQRVIHGPGGIRTHNPSKQAAENLRFRRWGHRGSAIYGICSYKNTSLLWELNYSSSLVLINCKLMYRKHLRILKRSIRISINLCHVTSEKNVILACTTLGNKQRGRGYRQLQETMTMSHNKVTIWNVWKRTAQ